MAISSELRRLVRFRAENCCEYCRLPQSKVPFAAFHIEHVIARQHGGSDESENLCLAYHWCNLHKGTNIAGLESGKLVGLYSPRIQSWTDHFSGRDGQIVGLTPVGRATVKILDMNDQERCELRQGVQAGE